MSFSKLLLFLLLTFSLQAYSNTTHVNTTVVMPSNITYDNQVYEANPSGFRTFIDENFKDTEPKIYRKLDKYVSELESSHFKAQVSLWGGVGVGTLLSFCGLMTESCRESADPYMIGTGLMLAGYIGYSIFNPGRSDYMKVINIHNKFNKDKPVDLKLGFAPIKDGAKLALNFRF